jgi:hypothetical protein
MDDAPVVGGRESVGDLSRELESLGEWKGAFLEAIGEGVAGNELEDEKPLRARFLQSIDGSDVRMVQRRENRRLPRNRARRSPVVANSSGRTLIATSRPSFVSFAR